MSESEAESVEVRIPPFRNQGTVLSVPCAMQGTSLLLVLVSMTVVLECSMENHLSLSGCLHRLDHRLLLPKKRPKDVALVIPKEPQPQSGHLTE